MVGPQEVGYLYGQYKRIYQHSAAKSTGLLWGGLPPWPNAAVRRLTGRGTPWEKEMREVQTSA